MKSIPTLSRRVAARLWFYRWRISAIRSPFVQELVRIAIVTALTLCLALVAVHAQACVFTDNNGTTADLSDGVGVSGFCAALPGLLPVGSTVNACAARSGTSGTATVIDYSVTVPGLGSLALSATGTPACWPPAPPPDPASGSASAAAAWDADPAANAVVIFGLVGLYAFGLLVGLQR